MRYIKLYSIAAAIVGLLTILFYPQFAKVYFISAVAFGFFLSTWKVKPYIPAYAQDESGNWFATFEHGGTRYRIEKDATYMVVNGTSIPCNCPDTDVAMKVKRLNEGKTDKLIPVLCVLTLASFCVVALPSCYPSQLATPAHVAALSKFAWLINLTFVCLLVLTVVIMWIRLVGGATVNVAIGEIPALQIGDTNLDPSFVAGENLVLMPERREKASQYAKRVEKAIEGLKHGQYAYITPPNGKFFATITKDGTPAIMDRSQGSDAMSIPPSGYTNELSREYERSVFEFVAAHQSKVNTPPQIDVEDPIGGIVRGLSACIAFLLLPMLGIAQNNHLQALNYLGANYEGARPTGEVVFVFEKLLLSGMGDGQKSFKDILTNRQDYSDAAPWGTLKMIKVSGIAIANIRHLEKQKSDTTARRGESARPLNDVRETTPDFEQRVTSYYSTATTEQRIREREAAVERFSRDVGSNIIKDVLSIINIISSYCFWILAIPGAILVAISKTSAAESAVFANGFPIFGRMQNWVHGLSAGILWSIVLFCQIVLIIRVSLGWIINIEPTWLAFLMLGLFSWAVAEAGKRIIPNKRVLGGQPYSGGNRGGANHPGLPM